MKLQLKDSPQIIECTPKILEKTFSISYLPHLEYANWEVEHYLRKKALSANKHGKIKKLALWLGALHGKKMTENYFPPLTIRWINDQKGYGAIADVPFQKWSFLGEYTGLVRRRKIIYPDLNDYCFMYPRQWLNFRPMTIDSEKAGNYTRFINHSDFPNLESVAAYFEGAMHIIFRALRDIEVGEELTYDYGDIYWTTRTKVPELRRN